MRRSLKFLAAPIIAAALLAGSVRTLAQEDASRPKPAAREYLPLPAAIDDQDPNSEAQSTTSLTPDTRPLTGVQTPTLGSPEIRHSYWIPGFQYGNLVRSSTINQPTLSNWNTTSYVLGNFSLLETWNRSQLAVNYSGGVSFSTDKSHGNDPYHQLGVVEALNWARLQLTFIDQFSYLPQTQFGFGASTDLVTPGIGGRWSPSLPSLQSNYQPNQSISVSRGPRYSNSITTQTAYAISRRGLITLSGSYGILRFVQAGNIDSIDSIFGIGYNYAMSQKDTIGALYRFTGYRYLGNPQAINDHVAMVAYGRKITGTLALQLFGGPDVTTFRVPFGNSTKRISGSGGGNLSYALSRSSLSIAYYHGVSGGSGQSVGSGTDQLEGTINRQLSRLWQGDVTFGFARNTSLGFSIPLSQTYDSWFAGGGLSRPLGRTANFIFGYSAYIQNSSLPVCVAGICSTSYTQHQISLGFQWHTRPLVLR